MPYPLLCVFACACANVAIIPAISPSQLTVSQQKKKKTFFSLYLYSPAYFTTGTKASDVKRDAHQTVAPYDEPLVQHTETFDG